MTAKKSDRPSPRESIERSLEISPQVFINYRRDDTAPAAVHLRHCLGQRIGEDKIFRDQDTIPLGQNFESVIEEAMRATSVCLVLIGPNWLTVKTAAGLRRLDDPEDYVRREIESALSAGTEVIPVLMDGAKMPLRKHLPDSIKELAIRNAYEMPWQAGIQKLGTRIDEVERQRQNREAAERAERERLDLTNGQPVSLANWQSQSGAASLNVVVRAMEISLARQGHKDIILSANDLAKSVQKLSRRAEDPPYVFDSEVAHIMDFVGIKALKSNHRYVARSLPINKLAEVPRQLTLGRPVLCGVNVQESWFKPPRLKSGAIDLDSAGRFVGGVLVALLGWDPSNGNIKFLAPWSDWGNHGIGTMTKRAAEAYLSLADMRSIEAVRMPASPFKLPDKPKPKKMGKPG